MQETFPTIVQKLLKIVSLSHLVCCNQKRIFFPWLRQIGKRRANVIFCCEALRSLLLLCRVEVFTLSRRVSWRISGTFQAAAQPAMSAG